MTQIQILVTTFSHFMSKFTHWVIVDDTSADIHYLGRSWFSEVGSWDSVGTYGMPYLGTLHGTSSSASFTFDFEGLLSVIVLNSCVISESHRDRN